MKLNMGLHSEEDFTTRVARVFFSYLGQSVLHMKRPEGKIDILEE